MFGLTGNLGLGVGSGHSQKTIHSGEGTIWTVRWKGDIIAWANDLGVRLYAVAKGERIAFIDRMKDSPRPDLFQCSLQWRDDSTLIIGWADLVKIVQVTARPKGSGEKGPSTGVAAAGLGIGVITPTVTTETVVEVTGALRLDSMIAGVVPWPFIDVENIEVNTSTVEKITPPVAATAAPIASGVIPAIVATAAKEASTSTRPSTPAPVTPTGPQESTSFLVLSYIPTTTQLASDSHENQRRLNSNPPELVIVTSTGEERSSDVLAMKGYERWGCMDYRIVESFPPPASHSSASTSTLRGKGKRHAPIGLREQDHGGWLVLSPKGVVLVRKRDRRDRVLWLVERERYEEALGEMENMEKEGEIVKGGKLEGTEGETVSKEDIGRMYLNHLFKLSTPIQLFSSLLSGLMLRFRTVCKSGKVVSEGACRECEGMGALDISICACRGAKCTYSLPNRLSTSVELVGQVLVPYVPFKAPQLSKVAYGIILVYYLNHDTPVCPQITPEDSSC